MKKFVDLNYLRNLPEENLPVVTLDFQGRIKSSKVSYTTTVYDFVEGSYRPYFRGTHLKPGESVRKVLLVE